MEKNVNTNTHVGPSFGLGNRALRVVWGVAYFLFFRFSPKPLHGYRRFILRIFGANVEAGAHVYPKVKIWAPWNLTIGAKAGIANDVTLYSQGHITIGENAVVSQGAHLCAGTHDFETEGFPLITKPIVIEDHAWIAAEAFVHPGVVVGEGCVVGARSVVTKDLPPWTVCSGFPAKVLKDRIRPSEQT